ncbi:MAG: hypothetical protein COB08_016490 [Rhodobacteraceae bacterium]|nr:hypothetical protein [Paracoccaceae bacterium]
MKKRELKRCVQLLESGEMNALENELRPLLEEGDLDARYLTTFFSDGSETGEAFDARVVAELSALTELRYPNAIYTLAWRYYHGDDVEMDRLKFKHYLEAATLLGHLGARRDLAIQVEVELNWKGFADPFEDEAGLSDEWPKMSLVL